MAAPLELIEIHDSESWPIKIKARFVNMKIVIIYANMTFNQIITCFRMCEEVNRDVSKQLFTDFLGKDAKL